jgi:hypothetical protein
MKKSLIIFYFFTTIVFGQVADLARIEYAYFPQKQSENSFNRFRAYVNYPIKLSEKGNYIITGLEYRNVSFEFDDSVNFDNSSLDRFDSYEFKLGYTFKINDNLRFAATSGILVSSNFEDNKVINSDVLFSGEAYLIKDKTKDPTAKKPWRLIAGLGYSTTTGFPFPLPIVNYYRKFLPNWTYAVGVPNSNIKHFITKKHVVQAFATLDGFYANIQRGRQIPIENSTATKTASNISMRVALGGLGYEYYITKHLVYYTYVGHTFINSIRLRDDNREDVYEINEKNSFYFRGGIKFNI